ncbi:MAG: efflux RND transporter periplasmic adaptor subunit [Candidatus Methylacidiphilales bacterium]|nr:HlyD family efflux transporter periplasmic adaptor subunit [Candidatus Methylacidiphilales bacterium]
MLFRSFSFYLALAGIVGAVLLVGRIRQTPPPPVPVAPPTRSPFPFSVAASGIVEAVRENVKIGCVRAGLVRKVFVEVGSVVKKGDPLMLLDDREASAKLATTRLQLRSLQAALETERILVADARDTYDRTARLERDKVASTDEFRRKEYLLKAALSRVAKQEIDIELSKAQVQQAETELEILTVRAPRDGTVLQVNIREGEFANTNPNDPLMMMGSTTRLQVRADVDEQNAPLVLAHQKAVAYLKGTTDNPIPLDFVRIEPFIMPKRSLTGDNSERVDTRVLEIILSFDRPEAFAIYVGQQVDVFIERPDPKLKSRPAPAPVRAEPNAPATLPEPAPLTNAASVPVPAPAPTPAPASETAPSPTSAATATPSAASAPAPASGTGKARGGTLISTTSVPSSSLSTSEAPGAPTSNTPAAEPAARKPMSLQERPFEP